MPVLVIHALHQSVQKSSWPGPTIRVGRDPACSELVLPGTTVSREHAVFQKGPDGRWLVRCLSETNPIIVDGALTSAGAYVSEGSEILIGTEYLLIFSDSDFSSRAYMGQDSYFSKTECLKCHWMGMVSTLRRQPTCPRCAGTDLKFEKDYHRGDASRKATQESTTAVDPRAVKAMLGQLKTARRSHIERTDGKGGLGARKDLSEDRPFRIARGEGADFPLLGFAIGGGVTVRLDNGRFVAESAMFYPPLKVNGVKTKSQPLGNGDILQIGGNVFRLVTE